MAWDEENPPPGEEEGADEHLFTRRLPPPPPLADRDVVYFAQRPRSEGRDYEDIMLRRVPRAVAHHFRGAAGARGLTHAQYLAALVALHEAMRQRADSGESDIAEALERLGLKTVSI